MPHSTEEFFDAIFANARRCPGSIALASRNGYMHYADLVGNIASAAEAAVGGGIRPGQLVIPVVGNPDMERILVLALLRIGCRIGFTIDLRLYEANGVAVDVVVADPHSAQDIRRPVVSVTPDWFKGADADVHGLPPAAADFSLIVSSSGSTGRPKLIELKHAAVLHWIRERMSDDYLAGRCRYLLAIGDRNPGGFYDVAAIFINGGTIIRPVDRSAASILDTVQLFKPDTVFLAPATLVGLLRQLDEQPAAIRKVGWVRVAGAYCAPAVQRAALDRFTAEIAITYGSSEASRIAFGHSSDVLRVDRSVGRIADDVDVAAFDESGARLPVGRVGEIRARPPEGMLGSYLGTDSGEQSAIKDGWFATGDIGLVDENRNLILRGRASNVINIGGSKVSPEEIEELLLAFDQIVEVGVTGVAVPEGYEIICAAIVVTAPVPIDELNSHLRQQDFPWPVQMVKQVREIPKTHAGKIDRQALKRLCAP